MRVRYWFTGNRESWRACLVFSHAYPKDEAEVMELVSAIGWNRFDRGPGNGYAGDPRITHRGSRVLVVQYGGLDV